MSKLGQQRYPVPVGVADPGCLSRIRIFLYRIPDPGQEVSGSRIRIKVFLPQKTVSKLSEICSGMFIPDPDLDFVPIPDPGVKRAPDPGSGSETPVPVFMVPVRAI